ncbi:hypothetical protein OPV22_014578 [Ensete ventricosum]|uniref:Reverse transcriptase zinc-binding domain-containing protein n=1 Tax=Ensete ventricosum TaxID=4639 RepID=A0AAV8R8C3_ENSVE|nr:hypothetical protein OPV22_014578 [Ensete ventricosum]
MKWGILRDRRRIPFPVTPDALSEPNEVVMVVFLFQDSRFSSLRTTLLKLELPKPIEYCRWSQFIMRDSGILRDRRRIPFPATPDALSEPNEVVMVVFLFQDSRFSSLRTTLLKLELSKPIEYCRCPLCFAREASMHCFALWHLATANTGELLDWAGQTTKKGR